MRMYEQPALAPDLAEPYLLPASEPIQPPPKTPPESAPKPQKRYSRPGHASGWIEERQGNKKRKYPTTSYFYCYDTRDNDGITRRTRIYVPVAKMTEVRQMIKDRRPITAILEALHG